MAKPQKSHGLRGRRAVPTQVGLCGCGFTLFMGAAGEVTVPNGSFEAPVTSYVNVVVAQWESSARPPWYDEAGGFFWDQLTGVFRNPAPGAQDHIEDMDGNQALWLFAIPDVAVFQDYESTGEGSTQPERAFDAKYEAGKGYRLTVGVIGGAGNMSEGAVIEARLYYRDEAGQRVSVAATTIAYSAELFPDRIHFVDFGVGVPVVRPEDPWAGKHIGIEFRSMVGFDLQGGYWDLDQVRFESLTPPVLSGPVISKGEAKFTVRGEPGSRCGIWVSPELGGPSSEWTQVRTLNLANGEAEFVEPVEDSGQRFYRATLLF